MSCNKHIRPENSENLANRKKNMEADLGMFSMFRRAGTATKRGLRGPEDDRQREFSGLLVFLWCAVTFKSLLVAVQHSLAWEGGGGALL